MRILFLVTILTLHASGAYAIKPASPAEIKAIQDQIYLGNRMDKEVGAAQLRLDIATDSQEKLYRKLELAREKDKQSAARTKAIHMTILAYGLEPASWSGKSVMPSTKDRTITWLPVARDSEARQIQSADGALQNVKQDKKDYVGLTYPDGVTIMPPKAFEKGPGYLASILLHERIHFEQITTAGKGNVMTYAEAQKEAYAAQVANGSIFFDVKNDEERKTKKGIESLLAAEVIKVDDENKARIEARKGLKGLIRRFLPPAPPPDIFEAKVHTNAELADISGLVAQARGQAEMARREREEREAVTRAAAEKSARLAHDEWLKNAWADIARRSCANPGSITQAELDQLPKSNGTPVMDTTPRGLGVCAAAAYSMLASGATAEELRRSSTPIVPINPQPSQQPRTPIRLNPSSPGFPSGFNPPVLPDLRQFALTACRAPDQARIVHLYSPDYNTAYKEFDDKVARSLAFGLDDCSRKIFYQLIGMIRAREYWKIDLQWIRATVASYKGGQASTPDYAVPPDSGTPPSQDDGCGTDPNGVQWCWK